jgi:outer membrane protein OmpA-like peptidoglycan-associated protein/opacity protein-like surface antigen
MDKSGNNVKEFQGGNMKFKTIIVLALVSIAIFSTIAAAADWTRRPAIGIRGPVWIPFDDIYGPEPFRMGLDVSLYLKYGITRNFVFDLSGTYVSTYDDTTATDDVNLKFMDKDLAANKLKGYLIGLTGNIYFLPEMNIQPYLFAGMGIDMWKIKPVEGSGDDISITDFGAKVGAGINFKLHDNITLDIQAKGTYELANLSATDVPGVDYSDWDQRPFRGHIEPSIGLTYWFTREADTDKDGVNDKKDNCPETPLGAIVDEYGCPLDGDGDGVYDGLDKCPGTPGGATVDIAGCPKDSDNDGVFDGIDQCDDTPQGTRVDSKGCPADTDGDGVDNNLDKCPDTPKGCTVGEDGCPLDADGDGVCDGFDKCPDTPKGCKVDTTGCPLDGDGDGVCDGLDKCPTTPAGTKVDENGCPVDVKPPVQKITLNIKYRTGSYEPDDNAKQVLNELVKTMKAYTGTVIEINGFTDNVGSESSNQVLSEKRANGVRDYLLYRGVDSERMKTRGYGENPAFFVGDNSTADGRQRNRRVEILSVER